MQVIAVSTREAGPTIIMLLVEVSLFRTSPPLEEHTHTYYVVFRLLTSESIMTATRSKHA
jgi:hypothetical protein